MDYLKWYWGLCQDVAISALTFGTALMGVFIFIALVIGISVAIKQGFR